MTDSLEILQIFLDEQTEALVHSIQSLVSTIRSDGPPDMIRAHMKSISTVVARVVGETQATASERSNPELRVKTDAALANLARHREILYDVEKSGDSIKSDDGWKVWTGELPPLAFEVAREVKELVMRVEDVGFGEGMMEPEAVGFR